jgi:hypothetical protein
LKLSFVGKVFCKRSSLGVPVKCFRTLENKIAFSLSSWLLFYSLTQPFFLAPLVSFII